MVCNRKKGIISAELALRSEAEYKKKWLKMKGEQEVVPRNNVQQSPKVPLPAPALSPSSGPSSTRRKGPTSRVSMEGKQEAMPRNNVQPSPKVPPPAPAPSPSSGPSSARRTGPTPRPTPGAMLQTCQVSGSRPQSRPNVSFNLNKPPLSPGTARPMARQNIVWPNAATPPKPLARHASVMPSVTTPTRPTNARPMRNYSILSPTAPRPPASSSPITASTVAMHTPVSRNPISPPPSTPSPSSTNSGLKRKEPWSSSFDPSLNPVELPETELAFDLRNRPFFCKLCVVDCQSMVTYKSHIRGRQHKAKLKLLSSAKSGDPISQFLQCDLCRIWCMNEDSLQQHYKGKNHILKLHAAQM